MFAKQFMELGTTMTYKQTYGGTSIATILCMHRVLFEQKYCFQNSLILCS